MAEDRFWKVVEAILLKEAASKEHERMKSELDGWASSLGYTERLTKLPGGGEPDVLRYDPTRKFLFVGDAKNSENETPSRADTLKRISGYLHDFVELLRGPDVKGGMIAIATDDQQEVQGWVVALNVLSNRAGIRGPAQSLPNFSATQLSTKTWVISW